MRLLEILTATLLAIRFAWPLFSNQRPRWVQWLPAAALATTLLHLALEGYRWQMLPMYALVLGAFMLSLRDMRRAPLPRAANRAARLIGGLLGLAVLALATALPALLPVPRVPEPTGPYPVGTLSLHLVDPERQELYAAQPGGPRELMVQVWYPAGPTPGAPTAPWMEDMEIMGPAISGVIGMPSFFLGHIVYARTPAIPDAPLAPAEANYPLLLFSHGWGGFRQQNTYQVIELASHGYVVAAVQHTYGAVATVFPDGRVAYNNPGALPVGAPEEQFLPAARQLVDQWAGDLGFVLDYLEKQNAAGSGSPFSGRLDLSKVGVFGHSTGGGATVEFCGRDPRCQAALGLDAYLTPVSQGVLDEGLIQPALLLYSELWPSAQNDRLSEQLQANAQGPMQVLTILGSDHYDFSDLPMLSPLAPQLGLKGPIDGARALRVINDYSLAFFDHYLKGVPAAPLKGETKAYPEVVTK
jgi:predicted dienelactone hydrolase